MSRMASPEELTMMKMMLEQQQRAGTCMTPPRFTLPVASQLSTTTANISKNEQQLYLPTSPLHIQHHPFPPLPPTPPQQESLGNVSSPPTGEFRSNLDYLVWLATQESPLPITTPTTTTPTAVNMASLSPYLDNPLLVGTSSPIQKDDDEEGIVDILEGMAEKHAEATASVRSRSSSLSADDNVDGLEEESSDDDEDWTEGAQPPSKRKSTSRSRAFPTAIAVPPIAFRAAAPLENGRLRKRGGAVRKYGSVADGTTKRKPKPHLKCPVGTCGALHPREYEYYRHLHAVHCPDIRLRPFRCHFPGCLASFVDERLLISHTLLHAGRESGKPISAKNRALLLPVASVWMSETPESAQAWKEVEDASQHWHMTQAEKMKRGLL